MKKILFLTNHYLPGYKAGGPIKSISSLCERINENFILYVITSDRDSGDRESFKNIKIDDINYHNNTNVVYLSKVDILNVFKWIKSIQPDVIHLNSFFSKFSQIVLFLNKIGLINSKIILSARGELSTGALSIKSPKKISYLFFTKLLNLYSNIAFHVTDKIEFNDVKNTFNNNKIYNIENLRGNIKSSKNLDRFLDSKILKLVFISRIARKKNLKFALEILESYSGSKKIVFDIYGTQEDEKYWNECNDVIKRMDNNVTVAYKKSLKPIEVPSILSQYHVFFLPTKNENFGHAIVEAMQNGVIPLISDQTPWDNLENYNAGYSLPLSNKILFMEAIYNLCQLPSKDLALLSIGSIEFIKNKLDTNNTIKQYLFMYKKESFKSPNAGS